MSKVISRLLTFFIGIPLVILLCVLDYMNYAVLSLCTVIASVIACLELYKMFSKKVKLFNSVLLSILTAILPLSIYIINFVNKTTSYNIDYNIVSWIFCSEIIILMGIESFKSKTFEDSVSRISLSVLTLFYAGFLTSTFLRFITINNSSKVLIIFFLLVFTCDSAAWFFGVLFGKKTRGVVAASPNKSLVGFLGGILVTILMGCVLKFILPDVLNGYWYKTIILSFFTAIAAIIGDLIESVIKRSCETKDSGFIIPGRGGLLDSIDSILVAAPVVFLGFHFAF